MKIVETTSSDEDGDYAIKVELTTEATQTSVGFGNGEPEDMTLGRDLNDAYSISNMLIEAYEAGKRGEEFEYISQEEKD